MQENIIIGIDSRQAEDGGDVVIRKLDAIKREADTTGRSIDRLGTSTENLGRASSGAGRNIVDVGRGVALSRTEMDQLKRSVDNANASVTRQGASWTGLHKDIMAGVGAMDKSGKALKSMHKDLGDLEKRFAPATAAAKKYHDTLDQIARLEAKKILQSKTADTFRAAAKTELDGSMQAGHGGGHGGVNSSAIRESLVLMRELINGNYTRLAGSSALMLQYTGGLDKIAGAFKGAAKAEQEFGGAAPGVTAGLGAMEKQAGMSRLAMMALSGGIIVLTAAIVTWVGYMGYKALFAASELDKMLGRLGKSSEISGAAIIKFGRSADEQFGLARGASQDMAVEFAHNGAIATSQLEATTRAAAALASTMGGDTKQAMGQVGEAMMKIASGDVRALEGSFRELSFAAKTHITTLIAMGQTTQAQAALNDALTASMQSPAGVKAGFKDLSSAMLDSISDFSVASGLAQTFSDIMTGIATELRAAADAQRDYNKSQSEGKPITAGQAFNAGPMAFGAYLAGSKEWGDGSGERPAPQGRPKIGDSLPAGLVSLLRANGQDDAHAKGWAAAFVAESKGDSNSQWYDKGKEVYGLGQWRGPRLAQLKKQYGSGGITASEQVQFALSEARQKANGSSQISGATSAAGVADAVLTHFERPGARDIGADRTRAFKALGYSDAQIQASAAGTSALETKNAGIRSATVATANLEKSRVNRLPDDVSLEQRATSETERLIKGGMPAGDAARLGQLLAQRQQQAPRELAFDRGQSDAQFKTSLIGQSPEARARAEALRSAQLQSGGGELSRSTLTKGQEGAVTANVSTAMDKERQQRLNEMLVGMREETRLAAMLPQEAEKAREVEKARLIINDGFVEGTTKVSEALKAQIQYAVQSRDAAKLEGSIRAQIQSAQFEGVKISREIGLRQKLQGDALNDELEIEKAMWPARLAALQAVGSLEDVRVKKNLDLLETQLRQTAELDKQAAALRRVNDLVREYGGAAGKQYLDQQKLGADGADFAKVRGALPAGRQGDALFAQMQHNFATASWEAANRFKLDFIEQIDEIAGHFGGKFGAILQSITGFLSKLGAGAKDANKGGILGQLAGALGSAGMPGVKQGFEKEQQGQLSKLFSGHVTGMGSSFKSFQGSLQGMFGKGATTGSFQAGLGKVLGAAGMGMQMGDMANGLMKAIGIKSSKIGAEIGGAIGMAAFGPIGGAIGAIAGGLIGGAFKKPKFGGATISSSGNGQVQTGGAFGNDKAAGAAGVAAGNSVGSALVSIAQQLGGTLGAFGNIKIGQYKGDWRVSTTGGDLGGKHVAPGSLNPTHLADEAAAIAFAITVAIKNGAIQGISEASKRVLTSAKDPTSVLSAVAAFERLGVELLKVTDPARGAIEEFVRGFKIMNDQLKAAGYTTAELGKLEEVYAAQRKELMKQLTQPYRDLINNITNGPNSGKSVALQYQDAKTKFEGYAAAPAGSIKTDDFTSAAQAFFDLSSKMFGTTTQQFATDRSSIVGATNAAIGHVEAVGPPELLNAITQGAGETVNQLQQTNAYLAKIAAGMGMGAGGTYTGSGGGTGFGGPMYGTDTGYMDAF